MLIIITSRWSGAMKALCWHGKHSVKVEDTPDPKIEHPRDIIIKVTSTAICGSDLHIYNGLVKKMEKGDILGHEFMGEVVEIGSEHKKFRKGDRVVVPFNIACGDCLFCKRQLFSLCNTSNRTAETAREMFGDAPAGLFGYSHIYGGYSGGQAEYVRVPFGDVGPIKVPDNLTDEQVLFLSDILPTGYMAAENCNITKGDTVAVWGCGPVGQFTIQSAWLLGAHRVIAIDSIPERLVMAEQWGKAEVIDFSKEKVDERLLELTSGKGPDHCIDAVGTEAHGHGAPDAISDNIKLATFIGTDRGHALREAIQCCRKGGTVSVPGVYLGKVDNIPFGSIVAKALTIKSGQTHVQKYLPTLLKAIVEGKISLPFVITHRLKLSDAPEGYKIFNDKKDDCIKIVMTP